MFKELVHKADLGNGYYRNPILDGDYADPAVFREWDHRIRFWFLSFQIKGSRKLEINLPSIRKI